MQIGRSSTARRVVGIDLGTTNSVIAYVDNTGLPRSLVNFEGDVLTPSKVLIEGESVVVGREAAKAASKHCANYAEAFKRNMGEDSYPRLLAGRVWRPEVLSAMVLRRIRQDAERRLGRVDAAVITVPAYFDERRRRATYDAATIAECNVVDLINEPTAAAIAYAYKQSKNHSEQPEVEHVFVFDLGGGTMDATILRVTRGKEYRTLATDGEVQLGGIDWDSRLRDHLAEEFHALTGVDPLATPQGQLQFLQLAEHVKKLLSAKESVHVPCALGDKAATLEVKRAVFEGLTRDLVERTRATAEFVLQQAGMQWSDIDTVLTSGGSTRMPLIRRMLRELTGKELDHAISVDESVAHGAAIYAHLKSRSDSIRVVNVNSHSYRIIARPSGKPPIAYPLIEKNSPLPAVGRHVFCTRKAGQDRCCITVCEGDSSEPEFCSTIGRVLVDGLASAGKKRWYVQVHLTCMEDGSLKVEATVHDPDETRKILKRAKAAIIPAHGMGAQEVQTSLELIRSLAIN